MLVNKLGNNNRTMMGMANKWLLIVMVVMCCLMASDCVVNCSQATVNSVDTNDDNNLLITKNNKIVQFSYNPVDNTILTDQQQQQQQNKHWIRLSNNQQTFTIELSTIVNEDVNNRGSINSNNFLTQNVPTLSSLLFNKGYIRHVQQATSIQSTRKQKQQQHKIKGYKFTKPAAYQSSSINTKNQQINNEINQLLRVLIKQNNLTYLGLRLEDSFEILFSVNTIDNNITKTNLKKINVKYLYPTISQQTIPSNILSSLKIKQQQQHSSQNKKQTLQRRLSGRGLHQLVNFTLTLDDKTDIEIQSIKQNCVFQFTDILPQSTYVDVDQRREEIENYQVINVEKPAFDSKQYFYKYTVKLSEFRQIGVNKYLYQQPIHFRYPQPSLLNYTKVYLHPIEQARIICYDKQLASVSQTKLKNQVASIYQVQENVLFDRGTAKLPNADISKQKIVSIATLAVCLVTVLMITSRLKKL